MWFTDVKAEKLLCVLVHESFRFLVVTSDRWTKVYLFPSAFSPTVLSFHQRRRGKVSSGVTSARWSLVSL